MLQIQPCAFKATPDQMRVASHSPDGQAKLLRQVLQVPAADIFQFHVLEQLPYSFLRVEFGRARGQFLYLDRACGDLRQKFLNRLAAVDLDPVPDDQQAAAQLPLQMLEELHAVAFVERAGHPAAEQVAGGGESAHDAPVGVRLINPQLGPEAAWRIGAHRGGQEIEARFVNKHGHLPFSQRPLFKHGHRAQRQRPISSSSRWLARWRGTWGVHFKVLSKRDTCAW